VRIVAATNRDLDAMVAEGTFRQDLLYRLNVITLKLPALRERPDDVVALAERSLLGFAASYRRPARGFTDAAAAAIRAYGWPGNIRELRNVIERAVILCPNAQVDINHLSIAQGAAASHAGTIRVGAEVTLEALERAHILAVIANAATLEAAASTLGIDASTLYRKRKQYGV
jgi:NtrC-family two-component system response regulator AlgB